VDLKNSHIQNALSILSIKSVKTADSLIKVCENSFILTNESHSQIIPNAIETPRFKHLERQTPQIYFFVDGTRINRKQRHQFARMDTVCAYESKESPKHGTPFFALASQRQH
jgi:hypothetical protein